MRSVNNDIVLKIAGFTIKVTFSLAHKVSIKTKKYILLSLRPFVIKKKPEKVDYSIEFVEEIIANELAKKQSVKIKNNFYIKLYSNDKKRSKMTAYYPTALYELERVVNYLILELLSDHHSFVMHLSAAVDRDGATIFLGENEAGKSTILKLLKKNMRPICDDVGFIKKEKGAYSLYQTHYKEKNNYPKNSIGYKINKVFFLIKSPTFKLKRIKNSDFKSIFEKLAKQMLINKNSKDVFNFMSRQKNKLYYLYFTKEEKGLFEKLTKRALSYTDISV